MMTRIETLNILFNTTLRHWELPWFRGAVIKALPRDSVLFHNHIGDGFRYAYPLIQYKTINGKAAIVGIGKGSESIWDFFEGNNFMFRIGSRRVELSVESMDGKSYEIAVDDDARHKYRIHNWLPLNQDNYRRFKDMESLEERVMMLNRILTGNLLAMLKGLDIIVRVPLHIDISSLSEPRIIKYKKDGFMALDTTFISNLTIPEYIGLGKHASLGFGTVTELNNENRQ